MKVAVIGSRNIEVNDLKKYIPHLCDEIVSGGADGVDECARVYAERNNIEYKEYYPQYDKYGRAAPIIRNKKIIEYSDEIIAFWDGQSKGTKNVIDYCRKIGKKLTVVYILNN